MFRVTVWSRLTGEHRPVGEMVCEIGDAGRGKGAFRYDRTFLASEDAFALDPVALPLTPDTVSVDHPGVFSIFEDSLPDDWGRRLLVRKHNLPRSRQNLPSLLLALGAAGLGALSYSAGDRPEEISPDASIMDLSALVEAAEHFERGVGETSGFSALLGAGSSPGGARPKALVYDAESGNHYIAKFPSVSDRFTVVNIEAATMALAAAAGLEVPPLRLVQCGNRSVLLVQRFDLIPGGRRHMASMQTFLGARGYYQLRYPDLLNAVRKYSANPLEDSEKFYRQMVFNALVGNTDDHLKNFWMLYTREEGWRLSPAFDLLPDVGQNGEHVLFFDLGGYYPGREALERLGRTCGIRRSDRVVQEVFSAISAWKDEFVRAGVPEQEIAAFGAIDTRLGAS